MMSLNQETAPSRYTITVREAFMIAIKVFIMRKSLRFSLVKGGEYVMYSTRIVMSMRH